MKAPEIKKYVDSMIALHGNNARQAIVNNCVNSKYVRTSNNDITKIWSYLNSKN